MDEKTNCICGSCGADCAGAKVCPSCAAACPAADAVEAGADTEGELETTPEEEEVA